jgi:hypothetical protein
VAGLAANSLVTHDSPWLRGLSWVSRPIDFFNENGLEKYRKSYFCLK